MQPETMRGLSRSVLLGVIIALMVAFQAQAMIWDVNIVPEPPTIDDSITIITYGFENSGGVIIDDTNFTQDGTSLQLDIFITLGNVPAGWPWEHSETIGTLSSGIYDLQVRTFGRLYITQPYVLGSTYPTSFEVVEAVPEPATFAFLMLGLPIIRGFRKRKVESAESAS